MDYLSNLSRKFLRKQYSLLPSQEGKVPWEIVNRPGRSGLVDSWKVDSFRFPLNYVLEHLSSLFYHEKLLYTITGLHRSAISTYHVHFGEKPVGQHP